VVLAVAALGAWRQRNWPNILLAGWIVLSFPVGFHDLAMQRYNHVEHIYLTPYLYLGLFTMFLWIALTRYIRALTVAEHANATLAQRLGEQEQALAETHARLRSAERQQTLLQERQRLMRDMHDGVGSQLITLQHALEKGRFDNRQAADLVRECIDDLRLVIDSLDAGAQSMTDALANLRFRVAPRLAQAGIASTWDMQAPQMRLAPDVVLQLLRVLQEALTNVLKHSGAKNVHVTWRLDAGQALATLQIDDDGHGLPGDVTPGSRGLANMRQRAQRIGATLQVHSSERGTRVSTTLPVPEGD
jgi:signal transduction histidine kinase